MAQTRKSISCRASNGDGGGVMMHPGHNDGRHSGHNDHPPLDHGVPSLLESLAEGGLFDDGGHGSIVGTPGDDARDWIHQTTDFTCAVVSQEMILHEFGVNVSEAQLVHEADEHGWLSDHGTSPEDLGRLLSLHDVAYHINTHGSVEDITNELAHGHKIIVGVYADELWQQNPLGTGLRELLGLDGANHAIVLTGLDMSDPANPKVYVNDPGDPQGEGKAYPLNQFLEAWHGSGDMYVATDSAPSSLASHALFGANYHPELGAYMDPEFWKSFLKPFVAVGLDYVVTHRDKIWPGNQPSNNVVSSENQTSEERGLF